MRAAESEGCRLWLQSDHGARRQRLKRPSHGLAKEATGAATRAPATGATVASAGCRSWGWASLFALCPWTKIPECEAGLDLAICVSGGEALSGPALTGDTAASCPGEESPECDENRGASGRSKQSSELPYAAPLLRDSSAGKRIRYKNCPGIVRAQGCEHDDDLHPCAQYAGDRSEKSAGLAPRCAVSEDRSQRSKISHKHMRLVQAPLQRRTPNAERPTLNTQRRSELRIISYRVLGCRRAASAQGYGGARHACLYRQPGVSILNQ